MPDPSFSGKTVVVTGGGGGLGSDMAHRFCEAGAKVVVAEIDSISGETVASELKDAGYDAVFHFLDVRNPASSASLVETIMEKDHRIDVWVNNAGVAHKGPAETLPSEQWQ